MRLLGEEDALELRARDAPPSSLFQISSAARRMFDLAADPSLIAEAFGADRCWRPWSPGGQGCASRLPGTRSSASRGPKRGGRARIRGAHLWFAAGEAGDALPPIGEHRPVLAARNADR